MKEAEFDPMAFFDEGLPDTIYLEDQVFILQIQSWSRGSYVGYFNADFFSEWKNPFDPLRGKDLWVGNAFTLPLLKKSLAKLAIFVRDVVGLPVGLSRTEEKSDHCLKYLSENG